MPACNQAPAAPTSSSALTTIRRSARTSISSRTASFKAPSSIIWTSRETTIAPATQRHVSVGLRYEANPQWVPQLQVNLLRKSRDQGALADIQSTAGNVAYVSPGLTARVVANLHVFGFVQVPIYSNLYGYQLFPRYTVSVGASYAL